MSLVIDEQKATELWNLGLLDREICEQLGCNRKSFANWRRKRGMESNKGIFSWDGAKEVAP